MINYSSTVASGKIGQELESEYLPRFDKVGRSPNMLLANIFTELTQCQLLTQHSKCTAVERCREKISYVRKINTLKKKKKSKTLSVSALFNKPCGQQD